MVEKIYQMFVDKLGVLGFVLFYLFIPIWLFLYMIDIHIEHSKIPKKNSKKRKN